MTDTQTKLRSLILDFLYKAVCQGKSNKEIFALMESKAMPSMNEDQLNVMRTEFKEKELKHPEKMALFRKRLGV